MIKYEKPHLSFEEQLSLLKSRGMNVSDDKLAINYLQRIGYYRLSAYWYPFRRSCRNQSVPRRDDVFVQGTNFQHVVKLYVFDKRLRFLILDALERIEVAMRVDIANLLGGKDTFAHTKPYLLHGNFTKRKNPNRGNKTNYEIWLDKYQHAISRSKEDFVQHYRTKYGEPFPIWVAVEVWDFGLLSTFFQGMNINDRDIIAEKYGIEDRDVFESWLRCLNYIRNIVAHHSRLWNRNLIDQPKLPKNSKIPLFNALVGRQIIVSRVYIVLCILVYLMQKICPTSSWRTRIIDLINTLPEISPYVTIRDMGIENATALSTLLDDI